MREGDSYAVLETFSRAAPSYTDIDEIAGQTGLTIRQVGDAVAHLERLGLPVESHPVYGHRLPVHFDLIDREKLSNQLVQSGLNWNVKGALEVGSTNDLANLAATGDVTDGTTYFTEYQSKGRGRLGRKWHSPVGSGLWFSVFRLQNLAIEDGWQVTLGAGVAVASAISALTGLEPSLKWPNDVQIDGRKVAGILTESRSDRKRLKNSTIGIGVNVHLDKSDFPPDLREIATSIRAAGGEVRRGELLAEILTQLSVVSNWKPNRILSAWRKKCRQWGLRVRVERDEGPVEGIAIDLADNGAFVVELDDGKRLYVHSGDVTHLRTLV
jgi:BirA family biotin operon repressor/biotin-[acetyl-CoA-carboxylase] ligase